MSKEDVRVPEFKEDEIPPVDFTNFILGISQSVYIYLGIIPDPITGKMNKNLLLAKHTIDTIEMLKEKTRGNLTPDEESTLSYLLAELKLKYVEVSGKEGQNEK